MRLNDIKVGPRLALSFGLVLLITAVIAAVGVWRLQDLAAATQRLTSTDNERLRAAVQWRQGIDQNWIRTRAALLNADSSHLAQWQAEMDATSKGVDVSRKTVERLLETDEGLILRSLPDLAAQDFASLTRRYGVEIVAEKVESERQIVDILELDIAYGQGHLFGEPRAIRDAVLAEADAPAPDTAPHPPRHARGGVGVLAGRRAAATRI